MPGMDNSEKGKSGTKIHGDPLEAPPSGEQKSDENRKEELEIPTVAEHSTEGSTKIHGDELESATDR